LLLAVRLGGAQPVISSPPPDERLKADVLVIMAHPDDETLISGYLARAVLDDHKRVAVVYTTRGNGGQNLVGYEQAASLAEVRETEAREALLTIGIRSAWFLRAPDTPAPEIHDVLRSLGSWNHGNVLGKITRIIKRRASSRPRPSTWRATQRGFPNKWRRRRTGCFTAI
jgi:LmbE family N-acetylglucosaminyl deacetylase